ncbi:MAG TPA: hypothetical protein VNK04_08540 [Gemmataceae bacterium]|nr:hypothetical protein [Gemmataceae bacterium]
MASIQPLVLILHFFWLLQQLLKKLPTRVVVKDAAGTVLHEERYTSDVLDRCIDLWEDADGAGSQAPSRRWTVYDGDPTQHGRTSLDDWQACRSWQGW